MTADLVVFTVGAVVGAFLAGVVVGGQYLGFRHGGCASPVWRPVVNTWRLVEEACLTLCALFLLFVGAVALLVLVLA